MINPETARKTFEAIILGSKYRDNTPLGTMTINGVFHHYTDPDTDTMWLGFHMGLRCADRLQLEQAKLISLLKTKSL